MILGLFSVVAFGCDSSASQSFVPWAGARGARVTARRRSLTRRAAGAASHVALCQLGVTCIHSGVNPVGIV